VTRYIQAVLACVLLTGIALVCVSPVCNLAPAALSGFQAASIVLLLLSPAVGAACSGCRRHEWIACNHVITGRFRGNPSLVLTLQCSRLC